MKKIKIFCLCLIFFWFGNIRAANLLNVSGRGEVSWGQSKNNDGQCKTSYNKFVPESNGDDCFCGHYHVGCGAVALAELMWYWEWPLSSSYRTYNWANMPAKLQDTTSVIQEDEIAHLLADCANASTTLFSCQGSWTVVVMNTMKSALNNIFGYQACDILKRSDWTQSVWKQIMINEIDVGRPIIYFGQDNLIFSSHYFIIDGYQIVAGDYKFHINNGHRGTDNYDAFLDDFHYPDNSQMLIGLSPSRNNIPINIENYHTSNIIGTDNVIAWNNINLPLSGNTLSLESGSKVHFRTGNAIVFNAGFHAKTGCLMNASIDTSNPPVCNISISNIPWFNYYELGFDVSGANTFELQIYTIGGALVYQNAGLIFGNQVVVWKDMNANFGTQYVYSITLRNNCGEKLVQNGKITSAGKPKNSSSLRSFGSKPPSHSPIDNNLSVLIYPNPTSNDIFVESTEQISNLELYSINGQKLFQTQENTLRMGSFPQGIYLLKIYTTNGVTQEKIIKQ